MKIHQVIINRNKSAENDVIFLKQMVNFGEIVNVISYGYHHKKKIIYFYNVIWFLIYFWIAVYYFAILIRYSSFYDIETILEVISTLNVLGVSLSCLFSVVNTKKQWMQLIKNVNKVDSILKKKHTILKVPDGHLYLNLHFFVLQIPFLMTLIVELIDSEHCPWYWWIFYSIMIYQRYYIILMVNKTVRIQERRCFSCNQYLKDIFLCYPRNASTNVNDEIKKLKEIFCLINENIQQVNNIFGYQMLFIITSAFVDVLDMFSFLTKDFQRSNNNFIYLAIRSMVDVIVLPVST